MTDSTESRPLKRTIPPDLQRQVEDIQKKVPKTAGPPGDLDDRKKRWLVVGICLHTVISPVLRTYVVPVATKLCYSLTRSNNIHKQTYGSHLKRYPPTNTELNYEAINSNKTKHGRNKILYDYRVKSPVDLSRLFLQTHMTHFTAFDDSCDSSALLGIIVNICTFPTDVQCDAKQIRSNIRNPWAHCDFSEWSSTKYADSFQLMEQLVKHLRLNNREENKILGELNKWETNGQNFLNGTTLGLEIVDEIRQQTHVLSEYIQTLCTEGENQFIRVQKELRASENDLQKMLARLQKLETESKKHEKKIENVSALTTSVSREIEDLKAVVKRQEEDHIPKNIQGKLQTIIQKQDDDHIPKNIRAQHKQEISEWELDQTAFLVTKATLHIIESLPLNNCIVITGSSGCGKSSNIHHVALHLRDKYGYEIVPVLTGPSDIINYKDENNKQVFVVDDICGKETINIQTLQLWRDYSEKIEKIFKTVENETYGTVSHVLGSKLLISCRLHIYKEAQFQLVKLLTEKECNLLSPELCLLQEERKLMMKKYIPKAIIETVMESEENVDFFPLLCKMSKNKPSEEVVKLLSAPVDSIMNNLRHIISENKTQFCVLVVCILYKDGFNTDWLNLNFISEKKMNKLEDILKEFEIHVSKEMSRNSLKTGFTTLVGTYLKQRGTEYRIIHDRISKMAAVICGQYLTECFIKYAPSIIIRDHFILESISAGVHSNRDLIILSEDKVDTYFDRLLSDLKEFVITSTFHNKQLVYQPFRDNLIKNFGRSDAAKQILKDFVPKGEKMTTDVDFYYWYEMLTIPLIESVTCGYYDMILFLIDTVKCDVNVTDKRGRSLLYLATERGNTNVVKLLLENKIDMFNCESCQTCPLYVACAEGFSDIVNLLLQNSANLTQCESLRLSLIECVNGHAHIVHSNVSTDIYRRRQLRISSYQRHRSKESRFHSYQGRDSPLYVACVGGHIDIVKLLLHTNADVNICNSFGETPLDAACRGSHADIVELLLQNKASVSQLDSSNNSSLHAAFNGGHTYIKDMLLQNIDNDNDFDEIEIFRALMVECQIGNIKSVELLLKRKIDVNFCGIYEKRTLLHVACSRGHASIVNLLLKKNANISQCNSDGKSPLYMACANGHLDIVKILLQNNADISQCKSDGESPLKAACANGHADIVTILLQKKADVS